MGSYILYFIIGGTLVTAVAYVGKHGDGMSAAFVAGLPVLFIINVFVLYHNGGVSAGLSYARGALIYLPMFIGCVLLTMALLPRINMPIAMLAGVSVYALPAAVRPFVMRRRIAQLRELPATVPQAIVQSAISVSQQAAGNAEEPHS